MKIGILTFNCALNYGASLQMFALQKSIMDICPKATVEIINYRPSYFEKKLSSKNISSKNMIIKSLKILNLQKRKRVFISFQKKCTIISSEIYNEDSLSRIQHNFDLIFCGSDQVWNPKLTNNDGNFFLPFLDSNKKATYAVSMGSELYDYEKNVFCKTLINDFKTISVREMYSINQLMSLGIEPTIIRQDLDPVLLAESDTWNIFEKKKSTEKYILVFEVMTSKELLKQAINFARLKDLKIHYIGPYIRMKGIKYIPSPSFSTLYNEFYNAKYVFSNSYHGTLLSIVNMKQFYADCDMNNNNGGRIGDILKRLGLMNRCSMENIDNPINWKECNRILNDLRTNSLDYLRGVINCL